METDVPILIEQSRTRCSELEECTRDGARALDGLAGVADQVAARLQGVEERESSTLSIVQQRLERVDELLDQMLSQLQHTMTATETQVQAAQTGSSESIGTLSSGITKLEQQALQHVTDNWSHHRFQTTETEGLQGQLNSLMTALDASTEAAIKHALQIHQQVETKHAQVNSAAQKLQTDFGTFKGGVDKHHQSLRTQLDSAKVKSRKQLEDFQAELQKQLNTANTRVEKLLQETSRNLDTNRDGVEQFLDGVLGFLENAKVLLEQRLTPPVKSINQCLDAVQPVLNLLTTLRSIGLI